MSFAIRAVVVLSLAGAAAFFWPRGESDASEVPGASSGVVEPERAEPLRANPAVATAGPVSRATVSTKSTERSVESTENTAPPVAPAKQYVGTPRHAAVVCVDLGWGQGDPRGQLVANWDSERMITQRRLLNAIEIDEPSPEQDRRLGTFNANSERLRRSLVDRLGPAATAKVLEKYRLHLYDADQRGWVRLLANGRTAPVGHDDEAPMGFGR